MDVDPLGGRTSGVERVTSRSEGGQRGPAGDWAPLLGTSKCRWTGTSARTRECLSLAHPLNSPLRHSRNWKSISEGRWVLASVFNVLGVAAGHWPGRNCGSEGGCVPAPCSTCWVSWLVVRRDGRASARAGASRPRCATCCVSWLVTRPDATAAAKEGASPRRCATSRVSRLVIPPNGTGAAKEGWSPPRCSTGCVLRLVIGPDGRASARESAGSGLVVLGLGRCCPSPPWAGVWAAMLGVGMTAFLSGPGCGPGGRVQVWGVRE